MQLANLGITNIFLFIKTKTNIIIYFCLSILSIAFNTYNANMNSTLKDTLLLSFYGLNIKSINIFNILFYCVVNWGIIYLILCNLQNSYDGFNYYTIIRYGSIKQWYNKWLIQSIKSIIKYLSILLFIPILIWTFFSSQAHALFNNVNLIEAIMFYVVHGILQLIFYLQFTFILSWNKKNTFIGFSGLFFLIVFMYNNFNIKYLFPVGLNSLSILIEEAYNISMTVSLIVYNLLIFIFTHKFLEKSRV
jgi:hypothetical protein